MDNGIGPTLREARNRRKVDLSEVEAATKIRVRFLQALENEEWDALPGGAYSRGFIRTYANYLGLDGERLAEDFRQATSQPVRERVPKRVEPVPSRAGERRSRLRGPALVALVSMALVGLAIGIGLAGGDGGSTAPEPRPTGGDGDRQSRQRQAVPPPEPGVALRLTATDEVWVCLLDASERPLIEGEILEAGAEAGPFRSGGYEIALGNGSVTMVVDGSPAEVPPSSSPVGYEIGSGGELSPLEEGERPDCE